MVRKHWDLTESILKAYFEVFNTLGSGFLEKVYENALALELRRAGMNVVQQAPIKVFYQCELVGEYFADLLVNDKVIVELKAVPKLLDQHEAQLLNYLKATRYEVGLLVCFGPSPEFRRKAFDNSNKGSMPWVGIDQS